MPDIIADVQSISSFRRQPSGVLKQLKRPIVLTVNGTAAAVVQDAAAYQRLLDIAAWADDDEAVRQGLEDVAKGRTWPAEDVFNEIRRKYGIPD
jgi:prevent-host-death family protein